MSNFLANDDSSGIHIPLDRLQSQIYWYEVYQNEAMNVFGEDELSVIDASAILEWYTYGDLLGRRMATFSCDVQGSTTLDFYACKAKTMMHDYYGLSQRVAAMRRSSWRCADRAGTPNRAAPGGIVKSCGRSCFRRRPS
ncbi:MAG: hypothetical protein HS102_19320 [Planctomycetia bacterium]|nr:hypothetical protein [Planctomycetia bacterium]